MTSLLYCLLLLQNVSSQLLLFLFDPFAELLELRLFHCELRLFLRHPHIKLCDVLISLFDLVLRRPVELLYFRFSLLELLASLLQSLLCLLCLLQCLEELFLKFLLLIVLCHLNYYK